MPHSTCKYTFEFHVLVNAIASYNYVELPVQPEISIASGPPFLFKAVISTSRLIDPRFKLPIHDIGYDEQIFENGSINRHP